MSEVMRERRAALSLSQTDLAAAVGLDKRQIRRYEAGEAQPTLPVAKAIALALDISIDELAGLGEQRLKIAGDWWATWQTSKDGEEVFTCQPIQIRQRGTDLEIRAVERGITVEEGGFLWRGQLRLWDNEILMGWYTADDEAIRSKGTLYLVIHQHGQQMLGRWVGLSYDGMIQTGRAAIARTDEAARELIKNEPIS
ncbi:helix-turn-helix transcriptional regulator [Microlunatus elymi]|uniref:Helix-turn-helix transcriptional regulator n=1 Tax=Microlunatus elymi TaxID=2596828 RepID=A0A516PV21_9ACTN|nr:helix-turn-helix transcriptional regulator [Microlunatus elymi]QDP94993.1 helix-turn-helix transcriptional regulator [Microlunatus elymi]